MTILNADEIRLTREANFANDPANPNQLPLLVDEIKQRAQNIKREMFEIGRLIIEAKDMLPHGDFQNWIEANCGFSYQTANNFMNVYRCCLGRPELVYTFKPSVLYKIAAPQFPKDIREHLFQHSDHLKSIDNKSVRDIYEEYREHKIGPDHPKVKALIRYYEDQDQYSEYNNHIKKCFNSVNAIYETVTKESEKIRWPTLNGNQKTKLTKKQYQEIQNLIQGTLEAVNNFQPDYEIVENLKPQLKIKKLKRRIFRKSKF